MSRARSLFVLSLLAGAACSGGSSKPGAVLRGPGALAIFQGIVAQDAWDQRPYLAIGNERGDELRLLDLVTGKVVLSPGLVFPLSIPTPGRPMWVVSASLHDGGPDALAVIAAGSTAIELIDTWGGYPAVHQELATLPTDGEVLAMVTAPVPDGAGGVVQKRARIVVALTGGRLEIVELSRGANGAVEALRVDPPPAALTAFEPSSLAAGTVPGVLFAGSQDPAQGVAGITLPADFTAGVAATLSVVPRSTGVAIKAVTAASFGSWDPATYPANPAGALAERVIAAPVESDCGDGAGQVRCGLLAYVPAYTSGILTSLAPASSWIPPGKEAPGDETDLIPLALPAPLSELAAVGRPSSALLPIATGAGTLYATGLAVVALTDGGVYPVDLARWALASSASPTTGTGKAGVGTASSDEVTGSRIALWKLDKNLDRVASSLSQKAADLTDRARVHVTPGFTPADDWTVTWQGILPGLDTRGAEVTWDGSSLTVAVRVGTLAVANLGSLGVAAGDLVQLSVNADPGDSAAVQAFKACLSGAEAAVSQLVTGDTAAAQLTSGCATAGVGAFSAAPATATFRASALVLTGAKHGYAGRVPHTDVPTDAPLVVTGRRLFYVYDPCVAGSECVTNWKDGTYYDLDFPFPTGATVGATTGPAATKGLALALAAGFVKVAAGGVQSVTADLPARGTALRFTTRSGIAGAARRPLDGGTALASTLPMGLVLSDSGAAGLPVGVHASYTGGEIMSFATDQTPDKMTIVR